MKEKMHAGVVLIVALCALLFSAGNARSAEAGPAKDQEILGNVWIVFVEEPSGQLQGAYSAFLRNDFDSAVMNLRKAATFVYIQARRSEGEVREALNESIKELNSFISGLEGEPGVRAAQLEEAFARIEYRMALSHLLIAARAEKEGNFGIAGYALDAAAAHLLFTALWLDGSLDPEGALEARKARTLAEDVRNGLKNAGEKLGQAIRNVGRGLQKLSGQSGLGPESVPAEILE